MQFWSSYEGYLTLVTQRYVSEVEHMTWPRINEDPRYLVPSQTIREVLPLNSAVRIQVITICKFSCSDGNQTHWLIQCRIIKCWKLIESNKNKTSEKIILFHTESNFYLTFMSKLLFSWPPLQISVVYVSTISISYVTVMDFYCLHALNEIIHPVIHCLQDFPKNSLNGCASNEFLPSNYN